MSIFSEVKEHLTARRAAEYYGLQVKRNDKKVFNHEYDTPKDW